MTEMKDYYIETFFLWKITELDRQKSYWQTGLGVLFRDILKEFYKSLEWRQMESFWQEDHDLFSHISPEVLEEYVDKLKKFVDGIDRNDVDIVLTYMLSKNEIDEYNKSDVYKRDMSQARPVVPIVNTLKALHPEPNPASKQSSSKARDPKASVNTSPTSSKAQDPKPSVNTSPTSSKAQDPKASLNTSPTSSKAQDPKPSVNTSPTSSKAQDPKVSSNTSSKAEVPKHSANTSKPTSSKAQNLKPRDNTLKATSSRAQDLKHSANTSKPTSSKAQDLKPRANTSKPSTPQPRQQLPIASTSKCQHVQLQSDSLWKDTQIVADGPKTLDEDESVVREPSATDAIHYLDEKIRERINAHTKNNIVRADGNEGMSTASDAHVVLEHIVQLLLSLQENIDELAKGNGDGEAIKVLVGRIMLLLDRTDEQGIILKELKTSDGQYEDKIFELSTTVAGLISENEILQKDIDDYKKEAEVDSLQETEEQGTKETRGKASRYGIKALNAMASVAKDAYDAALPYVFAQGVVRIFEHM